MKYYNQSKDSEETPIYPKEKSYDKRHNIYTNSQNIKNNFFNKRNSIIIIISLVIFFTLLKLNSRYNSLLENVEKLDKRIELIESQMKDIVEVKKNRKIGIAIVPDY